LNHFQREINLDAKEIQIFSDMFACFKIALAVNRDLQFDGTVTQRDPLHQNSWEAFPCLSNKNP